MNTFFLFFVLFSLSLSLSTLSLSLSLFLFAQHTLGASMVLDMLKKVTENPAFGSPTDQGEPLILYGISRLRRYIYLIKSSTLTLLLTPTFLPPFSFQSSSLLFSPPWCPHRRHRWNKTIVWSVVESRTQRSD